MQVSAAGDIGKPIDAFSSTRWHSIETGRNIRTQFLYDNSIFPSPRSGAVAIVRSAIPTEGKREKERVGQREQPTYLTYRTLDLSPIFYPANGRTLFAHIAANSLPLAEESCRLFREFILNS